MVHRCPNCDTTVRADARFCSSCGHDLDSEAGLSETELDRIEEEEEFREEVRQDIQRRKLRNGCLGALVLMALVVVCTVVLVGTSDDGSPRYAGGLSGCRDFNRLLPDLNAGVLTDAELRRELQQIRDRTSTAEPAISIASTALLRAVTLGDTAGFPTFVEVMSTACVDAGYLSR